MQGAIICSQATLLFVLKREKMEREEKKGKETEETNGPISFLKRSFSSSFIKSRRRILFDWLITRSIHHRQMYSQQSDTAILDNLLRMTKRSLLPWLIFDLFNIRKLIFNLKQMYQVPSQHLDRFCTLKSFLMPSAYDFFSTLLSHCLCRSCSSVRFALFKKLCVFCWYLSLLSPLSMGIKMSSGVSQPFLIHF